MNLELPKKYTFLSLFVKHFFISNVLVKILSGNLIIQGSVNHLVIALPVVSCNSYFEIESLIFSDPSY